MRAMVRLFLFGALFFGTWVFPALSGPLSGKALAADSATTQVPPPDENISDIYDIKPLAPFPGYPGYVKWLAALGAAASILLLSYLLYRYYRKKRAGSPPPLPPPPEETALNALSRMRELLEGEGKAFYFRLSFIFREYLYHRYSINAPEMTAEELLPRMKTLTLSPELVEKTREFFSFGDRVKFADEIASRAKKEAHYKFVRYFVKQTTPSESEPDSASKSASQSQSQSDSQSQLQSEPALSVSKPPNRESH